MSKKILYFVRGGVATPEQKTEAKALEAMFRNAHITGSDFIEKCDAVAGDVPEQYQHLPHVGERAESAAEKTLPTMSNKELDAKAESLGIRFPAEVNAKAEKVAFIEAHLAKQDGA